MRVSWLGHPELSKGKIISCVPPYGPRLQVAHLRIVWQVQPSKCCLIQGVAALPRLTLFSSLLALCMLRE